MNIHDFLIDPRGKDWQKLLAYWIPPLPRDAALWLVNKLGQPIFATKEGGIHRLILGMGTV